MEILTVDGPYRTEILRSRRRTFGEDRAQERNDTVRGRTYAKAAVGVNRNGRTTTAKTPYRTEAPRPARHNVRESTSQGNLGLGDLVA